MKTRLILLLALAGLMIASQAGAKSFDRGLGNPKKVYIQKGTVSVVDSRILALLGEARLTGGAGSTLYLDEFKLTY